MDSFIKCSKCGLQIPAESTFCQYCGAKNESADGLHECPQCGMSIPEGSLFCQYCGAEIKADDGSVDADNVTATGSFTQGSSQRRCKKCGKPLLDNELYCKYCGCKYSDPQAGNVQPRRTCSKCGKAITQDSIFCPYCGANNNTGWLKKHKQSVFIIVSVVLVLIMFSVFAVPPAYQSLQQRRVDHVIQLVDQRKFTEAYQTMATLEAQNYPEIGLGLDLDVAGYQKLKDYIMAGIYYEEGSYKIASMMFSNLGNYRESRVLSEECQKLMSTGSK